MLPPPVEWRPRRQGPPKEAGRTPARKDRTISPLDHAGTPEGLIAARAGASEAPKTQMNSPENTFRGRCNEFPRFTLEGRCEKNGIYDLHNANAWLHEHMLPEMNMDIFLLFPLNQPIDEASHSPSWDLPDGPSACNLDPAQPGGGYQPTWPPRFVCPTGHAGWSCFLSELLLCFSSVPLWCPWSHPPPPSNQPATCPPDWQPISPPALSVFWRWRILEKIKLRLGSQMR